MLRNFIILIVASLMPSGCGTKQMYEGRPLPKERVAVIHEGVFSLLNLLPVSLKIDFWINKVDDK